MKGGKRTAVSRSLSRGSKFMFGSTVRHGRGPKPPVSALKGRAGGAVRSQLRRSPKPAPVIDLFTGKRVR